MLYRFQLTRSFKQASTTSRGSIPASTQWPLSELQSVLVHTLLHTSTQVERMFPKLTQQSMAKVIKGLGWKCCVDTAAALTMALVDRYIIKEGFAT